MLTLVEIKILVMKTKLLSILAIVPFIAFGQQYSNGGLSTGTVSASGVNAPAGYTWSEAQANTGNTTESNTSGGSTSTHNSATASYFLADDFVIPAGQSWQISSIEVFAYQSGFVGSTSPFNTLRLQIFSSDPSVAGAVSVFGDATTNRFASSTDAMMYRIFNSTTPPPGSTVGTTRKIWKTTGTANTTLASGTYWLKFQLQNVVMGNGGFTPAVTIPGTRGLPEFNGLQLNAITNVWTPLIDTGNPATAPDYPQDVPFIINYAVLGTNEVLQYDNRVVVYPNPVASEFKINLPKESQRAATTIEVYDMTGKLMKTLRYAEYYNVEDLTTGAYLLKINDGSVVKTAKLVKK